MRFPPVDELPEVEATEPLEAVYAFFETGRHSQNRPLNCARVARNTRDNGQPRQMLRVQVARDLLQTVRGISGAKKRD